MPWLFGLFLTGLLILLALVLSVARMKFVGVDELPGPSPTQHGSQIDHSFPFLESLNEVLETNRVEESQSHVHRMYFMGPNTFSEPRHLPHTPPEQIQDIVYEGAFNTFVDEINGIAAYQWWEGAIHSILSVVGYPLACSCQQCRRRLKLQRLREFVRSEYDHACLRSCRSRALYEGIKVNATANLMLAYMDFFLGGDEKRTDLPPLNLIHYNWGLNLVRNFDDGGVGVVDLLCSSGEHDDAGRVRNGERSMLFTDSGSFTTSHDDDNDSDAGGERGCSCSGSGVVHELVHNVVPTNGWLRRSFSSWQKGDVLGKGSFGTVYEGFTDDGFFFAIKEVSLLDDGNHGKQSIFQLQQEISLLSQFEHENIVQYLGTDKDKSTLYIFLEYVSKGSLSSLYQKYRLNDSQVSAYTRQIISGLKYLHDRNVVHRDIKCANILVDVSGSVKLADFGLAKTTKLNDVKSSKGSPYWMAPEVVNLMNQGYGLAADIWSLGCTVLEMLTRQPPYSDLEGMQALFRIGRGELPPIPESLSKDARDFILKCLQVNPCKRPTATQLLDHPFIRRPFLSPTSPASPRSNIFR